MITVWWTLRSEAAIRLYILELKLCCNFFGVFPQYELFKHGYIDKCIYDTINSWSCESRPLKWLNCSFRTFRRVEIFSLNLSLGWPVWTRLNGRYCWRYTCVFWWWWWWCCMCLCVSWWTCLSILWASGVSSALLRSVLARGSQLSVLPSQCSAGPDELMSGFRSTQRQRWLHTSDLTHANVMSVQLLCLCLFMKCFDLRRTLISWTSGRLTTLLCPTAPIRSRGTYTITSGNICQMFSPRDPSLQSCECPLK